LVFAEQLGVERRRHPQRWRELCYALVDELVTPIDGARETLAAAARTRGVPTGRSSPTAGAPLQQKKIARALG
jgi:hypothetical protein